MRTTVCKIVVFLLLLSLTVGSVSGCKKQSEEEFLATAALLLEKSIAVNELCFGEGLSYGDEDGYATGSYEEATVASREEYGVNTVEDIKALVAEVYSISMVDYIDKVIFNPVKEENTFVTYRRYFDAMDGTGNVALMVKKDCAPLAVGKVSYSNLRIEDHGSKRATVLVDITVSKGEESRTDKDVSLNMRREDGAWKFDTATYSSLK